MRKTRARDLFILSGLNAQRVHGKLSWLESVLKQVSTKASSVGLRKVITMAQRDIQMPLLHPVLRIFLFAIISLGLLLPFSFIASIATAFPGAAINKPQDLLGSSTALLLLTCYFHVPILISMSICRRLFDRASLFSLGLIKVRHWRVHLVGGFFGGFIMAALATLICVLFGGASMVGFGNAMLSWFAFYLLSLCFQSGMEELTMRGYVLQNLLTRFSVAVCIATTSALFSLLHLLNFTVLAPSVKAHTVVASIINIALFGAVAALLVIRTGALWAAIGLHWGWNFSCGFIFGSPVSGLKFEHQVLRVIWHGNEILTGGSFGLEGSVVVTVMLLAVVCWLVLRGRCEPSAWWMQVRSLTES